MTIFRDRSSTNSTSHNTAAGTAAIIQLYSTVEGVYIHIQAAFESLFVLGLLGRFCGEVCSHYRCSVGCVLVPWLLKQIRLTHSHQKYCLTSVNISVILYRIVPYCLFYRTEYNGRALSTLKISWSKFSSEMEGYITLCSAQK